MAVIQGRSSTNVQLQGRANKSIELKGSLTSVSLSGKKGKGLSLTPVYFVSATVPAEIVGEGRPYAFPQYVHVTLNPVGVVLIAVDSWIMDPNYSGTDTMGTYTHQALYTLPEHILGSPTPAYFTMNVNPVLIVSGGILNSYTGYKSRTFLSNGNFEIIEMSKSARLDVLLVGGGAGGGSGATNRWAGGGGGAGGLKTITDYSPEIGVHPVSVGAGGSGGDYWNRGPNGGTSSVFDQSVTGGAGGGGQMVIQGGDGASGGGSAAQNTPGGLGTSGIGQNGGAGHSSASFWWTKSGGGGGGAGGVGGAGQVLQNGGGAGGAGMVNNYRTGNNVTYAAGGRGGDYDTIGAIGSANSGNGGGGGRSNGNNNGASGGSGIVVIRYSDQYILE